MTPLWIAETASAFWAGARMQEPFPRSLRRAIARSLPLSVVLLSGLRVSGADTWLRCNGVACAITVPDRAMRACLVARYSQSFIFLDGADPEDEQRFSLAHELAHFLNDYCHPRRRATARLGPAAGEVFDGERPPRPDEQVRALLAGVPLGAFTHFMERTTDGHHPDRRVDAAERDADRLAFELLAPTELVLQAATSEGPADRERIASLLVERFGLPATPAAQYAAILAPSPAAPHPLLRRIELRG